MLNITRKPPTEAGAPVFRFEGNIDAQAAEGLRKLHELPPGSCAVLDFASVQRINSMGLALLLKLFEHCEARGVDVKVAHAGRMASMLFKMTRLDRFLAEAPAQAAPARKIAGAAAAPLPAPGLAAPPPPATPAARPAHRMLAPAGVASIGARQDGDPGPLPPPEGRLNFLANLQSSRQLNGWYFFNTYLQRRLGRDIHLDLVHAAWDNELRPAATHLVFAQPFQATRLLLEHGFHLAARPAGQADEVTVLARADEGRREMAEFAGGRAVTDTEESFTYLLGRFLLDEGGLPSDSLAYSFAGHEIKAVRSLLDGQADLLFLPTENYDNLSALTKSRLRPLDASDSGLAFHAFCAAPSCVGLLGGLRSALLDMSSDAKGRQVLEDLALAGWDEPAQEEIDMLAMLYKRYAGRN